MAEMFTVPEAVGPRPIITVVIPTVSGREDSLKRCTDSYIANTSPGCLYFIVVKDEPTVGRAWRAGIEQATTPYIHRSCDDLEVTSPTWAGACAGIADEGKLPCPIVRRPDGSLESCGGDMNASACLISELQECGTEVDFTTVPFLSREQAEAIGMLNIHYGADVWVSYRGRQLDYSTVIVCGYEFIHHRSQVGRKASTPGEMMALSEALAT